MALHLRRFRGPLCSRRFGFTPHAKGDKGQKECAGDLRRTFDEARATGSGFDVVGSKEVC